MTYHVRAVRWAHGWELHIADVGVTQSHTLADAETMVRDYLAVDDIPGAATAEIALQVDLGGLESLAIGARQKREAAQVAQDEAARASRRAVAELRRSGLSVSDTATVMGVTKGRISQLAH